MIVLPPSPSAGTRSGAAWASAPVTASITRNPVIPRAPQAAGNSGFTTVPSSAVTVIARK